MRSYKDALERVQGFEAEQDDAEEAARRKRAEAGLLQASDDFAAALSGGGYKGTDVAGPMREEAKALEDKPLRARLRKGKVQELATASETEDSGSERSAAARRFLAFMAPGIADKMGESFQRLTAGQVTKFLPQVDDYLRVEMKRAEASTPNPVYASALLNAFPGQAGRMTPEERSAFGSLPTSVLKSAQDAWTKGEEFSLKSASLDLDQRRLAETERAHKAGEGIDQGRLALAKEEFGLKRRQRASAIAQAGGWTKDDYAQYQQIASKLGEKDTLDGLESISALRAAIVRAGGINNVQGVGILSQFVPTWALGGAGKDFRQALQFAINNYIKGLSGAAVSESEWARIQSALQQNDEQGVLNALGQIDGRLKNQVDAAAMAATPRVREALYGYMKLNDTRRGHAPPNRGPKGNQAPEGGGSGGVAPPDKKPTDTQGPDGVWRRKLKSGREVRYTGKGSLNGWEL